MHSWSSTFKMIFVPEELWPSLTETRWFLLSTGFPNYSRWFFIPRTGILPDIILSPRPMMVKIHMM